MQEGQTVDADGYEFTNQTVFILNVTLQSAELVDGTNYTVTVIYDNPAGGLQRNASSNPVQVSFYCPSTFIWVCHV